VNQEKHQADQRQRENPKAIFSKPHHERSHAVVDNTTACGRPVPRWSPDGTTLYFTNCVAKDYGTDCEILVSSLPH
jgi:hypothetical protein